MWCDHPLSQRNKTGRAVGVGVGGNREGAEGGKKLKKRGGGCRQYWGGGGREGGLHKIGG